MKEPATFVHIQDKLKGNWNLEMTVDILWDTNIKPGLTVWSLSESSPFSTEQFRLSYACLKWNVKTTALLRWDSSISPGFVSWRQYSNSSGACTWLVEHNVISLDILQTGEHWLLQPLLYKDITWVDFLLKLKASLDTFMSNADSWIHLYLSDIYL